jgi:predicted N-acetyltransferase YhbS
MVNPAHKLETLNEPARADGWTPVDSDDVSSHRADTHRVLVDAQGRAAARCSLWWRSTPPLSNHRLGVIGHYAASSAEAGVELLNQACAELADNDCTLAVGPMDGSTWRRYRLVTDCASEAAFFLEPENPPEWPRHFEDAGFTPLAHYHSSVTDRLDYEDPKARCAEARLSRLGIKVRTLDTTRLEEELRAIHEITTASFRNGFLYQPLPWAAFRADYRQIQPFLRPELVLIATHQNRPIGFVFSIPDLLQARRGRPIDTVILKTIAVVPDCAYAGLGRHLVQQTHRRAHALGYRRVIHALMREGNVSLNISARYARRFRRYTLFAKPL